MMDQTVFTTLSNLPRLALRNAAEGGVPCKICGDNAPFFDVTDFNKCIDGYAFGSSGVTVTWNRCPSCDYLFTNFFDDWRIDDFRRFIYNDDYLLVDGEYAIARPRRIAARVANLLRGFEGCRVLDYGSGAGVASKVLTDLGFPTENFDPLSSPDRPSGRFDVIVCAEVVEHSPAPIETLRDMASLLSPHGIVLLGEALQPTDIEHVRTSWFYAAPRNGHISLYSARTLAVAADQVGWRFHRGGAFHAFTSAANGAWVKLVEAQCGSPILPVNLGAPLVENNTGWHAIEQTPIGSFRWMSETRVGWSIEFPVERNFRLHVRVPVISEPVANECQLIIGGRRVNSWRDKHSICGESEALASPTSIFLEIPALFSPHERTGSPDMRRLGLAVSIIDPYNRGSLGIATVIPSG